MPLTSAKFCTTPIASFSVFLSLFLSLSQSFSLYFSVSLCLSQSLSVFLSLSLSFFCTYFSHSLKSFSLSCCLFLSFLTAFYSLSLSLNYPCLYISICLSSRFLPFSVFLTFVLFLGTSLTLFLLTGSLSLSFFITYLTFHLPGTTSFALSFLNLSSI